MKSNCETYLEFKYSYFLFMKYLLSPVVTSTFGLAFPNNIASFLRKYGLTWENGYYCIIENIFDTMGNTVIPH